MPPAVAQNKDDAKPAGSAAASRGLPPATTIAFINDLGLLKALVPLKLTPDQNTRLLAILRQIAEEAKTRAKQDEDALRALSADVETARRDALAGVPVTQELEERVAQAAKAAEERSQRARRGAANRILGVAKAALTPEQRVLIAEQSVKALGGQLVPRQYQSDPSKAPPEVVQDLATVSFIERVLLNERAIEVLSQMKPPAPSATPVPDAVGLPPANTDGPRPGLPPASANP